MYTGETVSRRRGRSSSHKTIMFMLPRCSLMSIWQWSFCLCALPAAVRIFIFILYFPPRDHHSSQNHKILYLPTQHTLLSMLGRVFIKTKHYFTRVISKYFFDCKGKTKVIRVNNKKYSSTPIVISLIIYRELFILCSLELYSFQLDIVSLLYLYLYKTIHRTIKK